MELHALADSVPDPAYTDIAENVPAENVLIPYTALLFILNANTAQDVRGALRRS